MKFMDQKKKTPEKDLSFTNKRFFQNPSFYAIIALLFICFVFFHKVIFGIGNFWEDLMYQEFPHRIFARDALLHFSFPFWNPYTFGGMPFFAAIHTGVLYPVNLILSFLPFGKQAFWYALELSVVLHIFIAGATMFLFCNHSGRSRLSSFFAAISYMLCGFFVVHTIHSLMLYILAWLPLIMLFMHRGTQKNLKKDFIYAGLVLGITVFAGHPQITFYEFLFLGAYAVYLLLSVSGNRRLHGALLFAMFAVAGGLAMIVLLPAAELSKESSRVAWTFQMASEGSMSFRQLSTLIIPKLFGGTNAPNPWREELSFWLNDSFHSGYWTFWETTFYTGLAALIFGMVQFIHVRRSKFTLFCAIWCVVSLGIALGSHFPLYELLFKYVPGFGTFRVPARILFTWNLLLPLLAARTIDEMKDPESRRRILVPLAIGGGICLSVGLSVVSGFSSNFCPEFMNHSYQSYAARQSGIMLAILAAGAAATILLHRSLLSHRMFKGAMLTVLCIDLFVFGMDYHIVPYSAPKYFSRNRQLADYLSAANKKEPFRTKMREGGIMLLDRNQGMIDRIFLMEGYNPLNLSRKNLPAAPQVQLDLFNVKYAIRIDSSRGTAGLVENPSSLPHAKMFFRAAVFRNDSAVNQYLRSANFRHQSEIVLTGQPALALPADTVPVNNTVAITNYQNNKIELSVSTEKNGILWLSEIWYPAWKVMVDGKVGKILRADYCFMAVEVEKGKHRITFNYASKAFTRGALISLLTLVIAVGLLVFFQFTAAAGVFSRRSESGLKRSASP
jgi:hypothetical protein